jgi:hypothetical protein
MACLTNPGNKTVRDARWPNTRIKLGKELCQKVRCDWDKAVSFLQVPLFEEKFNCNIYILDVRNIPMLGSSVSLMMGEVLMCKSESRNSQQYFLLYDEVKQHYDCITDIKQFLGVRCFCYGCMKGFSRKSIYDEHKCGENETKRKKVDKRNEGRLLKDLSHYIERGFTKGSAGEIAEKNKQIKKVADRQLAIDKITNPKYVIFDFEKATRTRTYTNLTM